MESKYFSRSEFACRCGCGFDTVDAELLQILEKLRKHFWQSVSEGPSLRSVSHGTRINSVMTTLFGQQPRAHDYLFLRPSVVGRATRLHYDLPFFGRGSKRIVTVWTALGDISVCDGPLVVVEGSRRFDDLIEPIRKIDYQSNDSPQGPFLRMEYFVWNTSISGRLERTAPGISYRDGGSNPENTTS